MLEKAKKYAYKIISLYMSGPTSPEMREKVMEWLSNGEFIEEKSEALLEYWETIDTIESRHTYETLVEMHTRLGISLPGGIENKATATERLIGDMADPKLNPAAGAYAPRKKTLKVNRRLLGIAAAVVPLIVAATGVYLLLNRRPVPMTERIVSHSTTEHLTLADNSDVWIHPGSKIKYAVDFGSNREVYLEGEAYFSVKHDDNRKPFIVRTPNLKLTVIGTEFNVSAFPDSNNTRVTLFSGRVEVKVAGRKVTMEPGHELVYNHNTCGITIREVSDDNTRKWRLGSVEFNESSLDEIFTALGKIYRTTMITDAPFTQSGSFMLELSGQESLDDIMSVLKTISNAFTYTIEQDKVTITHTTQ